MLDTLALPFELIDFFDTVGDIYSALPLVVRFAIAACFSVACLFACIKLLF